jgi:hypothetical protein
MRLNLEPPPCVNCITLPMCRAILQDKKEVFTTRTLKLLKKCTLLSDYVHCPLSIPATKLLKAVNLILSGEIKIEDQYERKMY